MTQLGATARSFVAQDLRWPGRENDLKQYADLGIESWPLEQIKAPVIILHGTADVNAPYAGSVDAVARMPNAELVSFDKGEHTIIVSEARPIRDRVQTFLAALPPE
jgi:pimeloyl-ACP methyl ester carboxylesterase